jgi:hypothetical protein
MSELSMTQKNTALLISILIILLAVLVCIAEGDVKINRKVDASLELAEKRIEMAELSLEKYKEMADFYAEQSRKQEEFYASYREELRDQQKEFYATYRDELRQQQEEFYARHEAELRRFQNETVEKYEQALQQQRRSQELVLEEHRRFDNAPLGFHFRLRVFQIHREISDNY